MTIEQYGLYTHARELSHETGKFYFSGRAVALHFRETRKATAYRVAEALVESGWFQVVQKSRPGRAAEYRPFSHEEWAAAHPNKCDLCPEIRTDIPLELSRFPDLHVQVSEQPCPEIRTIKGIVNRKDKSIKIKRPRKNDAALFCRPDWIPEDAWARFCDHRKSIGRRMNLGSCELAVKRLAEFRDAGDDPGEVLDQSTLNGWQGLFPIRKQNSGAKATPRTTEGTRFYEALNRASS
jgi:hypothetical protein